MTRAFAIEADRGLGLVRVRRGPLSEGSQVRATGRRHGARAVDRAMDDAWTTTANARGVVGRALAETIANARRGYNPCGEYELDARGMKIAAIENLSVARDQYDCYDMTGNEIVRVENFPPMRRMQTLMLGDNRIARVRGEELGRAAPRLRNLTLVNNSLRNLGDLDELGAIKKLTHLSLSGNPVCAKENYRLYVIYKCKALKTLDFCKVKAAERELAEKMFGKDDGAAARAKTFTPGDGLDDAKEKEPEEEAKPSGPSPEQLLALKAKIAQAETLEEIARLENALKTGVVPADFAI